MKCALCYDKEKKRLYKGVAGSPDCVFPEYDKKGFKTYKVAIQEESIEIVISSNLHYQGASFLYAKILIKGQAVLNFQDKQTLYLLNDRSLDTFQVPAGNWDELFDTIVNVYNNHYLVSEMDIDRYFGEIDDMIQCDKITVYRNKTDIEPHVWEGCFLVLLHSLDVVTNIIKCYENSILENNQFLINRILQTCNNYMQIFANSYLSWEKDEEDSRMERFSKELVVIHTFIDKHGKPFEFVNYLIASNNNISINHKNKSL